MTSLHERLTDLADLGAPGGAVDPSEPAAAWQRGVAFRRRRRVGTAAIVVVALALLTALSGTAFVRSDSVIAPAGSTPSAGLPDRFYEPSPWLAGTDDEGPLGQLAVILPADRGSWTGLDEREWVGVSATTGEYRFLDLPDRAEGGELSPDGTRVAYWTTGPVTGTPNTSYGQALVIDGFAVHDSTSGETSRVPIESEHGLMLSSDDMYWADEDTLLIEHGRYLVGDEAEDSPTGSGFGNDFSWTVWSMTEDGPVLDSTLPERASVYAAAEGKVLLDKNVLDLADGSRSAIKYSVPLLNVTALDPSGTRVALPGTGGKNNKTPSTLQVTSTDGTTTIVPDSARTYAVLAWSDDDHVVVWTRPQSAKNRALPDPVVELIDVGDGTRQRLIDTHYVGGNTFQLATDLLAAPTVAAVEPPRPLDPRWVAGGLASILVLAGVALVMWRRRVAP